MCVANCLSFFFSLLSAIYLSLSSQFLGVGLVFFHRRKREKILGEKKKEKKSPAHVSQFVVLLILFFVSSCLKSVCKEPNKIAPHFFFFFCHLSRMVRST